MDYDPVSNVPLGFSENSTVGEIQCLNISILDDSMEETSELFFVNIAVQYEIDQVPELQSAPSRVFVTIIDNDGEEFMAI